MHPWIHVLHSSRIMEEAGAGVNLDQAAESRTPKRKAHERGWATLVRLRIKNKLSLRYRMPMIRSIVSWSSRS